MAFVIMFELEYLFIFLPMRISLIESFYLYHGLETSCADVCNLILTSLAPCVRQVKLLGATV
jgi:hypothetical protein